MRIKGDCWGSVTVRSTGVRIYGGASVQLSDRSRDRHGRPVGYRVSVADMPTGGATAEKDDRNLSGARKWQCGGILASGGRGSDAKHNTSR